MLNSQASAASAALLLPPVSAANTAAATTSTSGGYVDVRAYQGELLVTQITGAITGSVAGKLQYASDANGTGATDITGATFTNVSAANKAHTVALDPKKVIGGFLGYLGTVTTGPVVIGVVVEGKKQIV